MEKQKVIIVKGLRPDGKEEQIEKFAVKDFSDDTYQECYRMLSHMTDFLNFQFSYYETITFCKGTEYYK